MPYESGLSPWQYSLVAKTIEPDGLGSNASSTYILGHIAQFLYASVSSYGKWGWWRQ
jgi:hypothetical protein